MGYPTSRIPAWAQRTYIPSPPISTPSPVPHQSPLATPATIGSSPGLISPGRIAGVSSPGGIGSPPTRVVWSPRSPWSPGSALLPPRSPPTVPCRTGSLLVPAGSMQLPPQQAKAQHGFGTWRCQLGNFKRWEMNSSNNETNHPNHPGRSLFWRHLKAEGESFSMNHFPTCNLGVFRRKVNDLVPANASRCLEPLNFSMLHRPGSANAYDGTLDKFVGRMEVGFPRLLDVPKETDKSVQIVRTRDVDWRLKGSMASSFHCILFRLYLRL